MNNEIAIGVCGFYTPTFIKEDNTVHRLVTCKNMIVNGGLVEIMNNESRIFKTLCLSSDITEVNPDTNDIGTVVAQTTNVLSHTGGFNIEGMYSWYKIVYAFDTGKVSGNITKVGIKSDKDVFVSISRLVDDLGSQIVISPLANERLQMEFEFRVYLNTQPVVYENVAINAKQTVTITQKFVGLNNQDFYKDSRWWGEMGIKDYLRSGNYPKVAFCKTASADIRLLPTDVVWNSDYNFAYSKSDVKLTGDVASAKLTLVITPTMGRGNNPIMAILIGFSYAPLEISFSEPIYKLPDSRRTFNISFVVNMGRLS